jgi:peptide-methionine (S)-S-oxide reductase
MSDNVETAILAGACFWGVQELLRNRDGVISTRVGYTGGENDHPSYGNHPGHAEAVEIVFDPERISYRDILEFFFQIHDPTTKDRQDYDIDSAYRSEIFAVSDEQRQVAEDTIADVEASGLWPGKVVTEISEAVAFWEAEPDRKLGPLMARTSASWSRRSRIAAARASSPKVCAHSATVLLLVTIVDPRV